MRLTRKSFNKVVVVLRSPIFALVFAIVLGGIPYMSVSEKVPSYSVGAERVLADGGELDRDFRFFWKKKELDNIKQTYLTVWNDGEVFVDYSDFTDSFPITFESKSGEVEIYDVKIVQVSRKDIKVDYKIVNEDSTRLVEFKFVGDDALEEDDGFKARVTYSSPGKASWSLNGRVKGARNGLGFEEMFLVKSDKTFLTNVVSILLLLVVIVRLVVGWIKEQAFILKTWELVFVLSYILILYVIPFIFSTTREFSWIDI
ncbi:hypothetical protein [Carboxylicivirga taeanensis]|uniref:hypothetical protein n=1 Tax=Carboxylicivirga taeanensis TaxID=1416875 RepID=UPI003F6E107B